MKHRKLTLLTLLAAGALTATQVACKKDQSRVPHLSHTKNRGCPILAEKLIFCFFSFAARVGFDNASLLLVDPVRSTFSFAQAFGRVEMNLSNALYAAMK